MQMEVLYKPEFKKEEVINSIYAYEQGCPCVGSVSTCCMYCVGVSR